MHTICWKALIIACTVNEWPTKWSASAQLWSHCIYLYCLLNVHARCVLVTCVLLSFILTIDHCFVNSVFFLLFLLNSLQKRNVMNVVFLYKWKTQNKIFHLVLHWPKLFAYSFNSVIGWCFFSFILTFKSSLKIRIQFSSGWR